MTFVLIIRNAEPKFETKSLPWTLVGQRDYDKCASLCSPPAVNSNLLNSVLAHHHRTNGYKTFLSRHIPIQSPAMHLYLNPPRFECQPDAKVSPSPRSSRTACENLSPRLDLACGTAVARLNFSCHVAHSQHPPPFRNNKKKKKKKNRGTASRIDPRAG